MRLLAWQLLLRALLVQACLGCCLKPQVLWYPAQLRRWFARASSCAGRLRIALAFRHACFAQHTVTAPCSVNVPWLRSEGLGAMFPVTVVAAGHVAALREVQACNSLLGCPAHLLQLAQHAAVQTHIQHLVSHACGCYQVGWRLNCVGIFGPESFTAHFAPCSVALSPHNTECVLCCLRLVKAAVSRGFQVLLSCPHRIWMLWLLTPVAPSDQCGRCF